LRARVGARRASARIVLGSILAGVFAASRASRGQEAPAEPAAFQPHFTLRWDFLARYDNISHLVFIPNISRGRVELRPEVGYEFSDRFRIAARGIADYGTDSNSQNARNFDNYRSRGVSLERYYIEAKPGGFMILAGAFGMPILASEMLWDHDIQTPGAFVNYQSQPAAGGSTLSFSAAGFYGPQSQRDHTRIGVGQVLWKWGEPDRLGLEAAAAYWHFEPDGLKLFFADGRPDLIRQNYIGPDRGYLSRYRIVDAIVRVRFPIGSVPVLVSLDGLRNLGTRGYISRFHIGDLLVRARFPIGSVPLLVSIDGLKNFGARGPAKEDGEDFAYEASVTAGRVGTPGNVRGYYTFQHVERDALIGAYNTDDWWFHSWYRGHRFGLAVTIFPQVFVQGTAMFQQRLDRKTWINRFTADLVKMF